MLHVFFRIPHGCCFQRPGGPTNQRRLLNESININTQTEAGGSTQLKLLLIRVTLWPPLIRDADRGSGCVVILSFKWRASGWEDPSRGKREIKTAETSFPLKYIGKYENYVWTFGKRKSWCVHFHPISCVIYGCLLSEKAAGGVVSFQTCSTCHLSEKNPS